MNKAVVILSFLAITGYTIPDESLAHTHILGPLEVSEGSVISVERGELIGPLPMGGSLSHGRDNASWDWLNLTHTDTPHLFGRDAHPSGAYRNSQPADGTALMFSWPFESLPTFPMGTDAAQREKSLNQDNEMTHPYLR